MDTDTGLPSDESVPSPSQPQLFQENGAASAQSGQNTGEDSAQTPAPSALLRSAPENAYEEPGLPLVASDGEKLYFQPYPSQKNGGSLMVWDGTALSSTGISHADSLIAVNGGYSYTIENKLYHGSSLVRDFSDEALLGTHAFSLRVFGSDSSYFYLYANAADSVSGEVSPYVKRNSFCLAPMVFLPADGSRRPFWRKTRCIILYQRATAAFMHWTLPVGSHGSFPP